MTPFEPNPDDLELIRSAVDESLPWDHERLIALRKRIKAHYVIAQRYLCCYCRESILSDNSGRWDAEHIISKRRAPHFMFEPLNLAASCRDCNIAKLEQHVLTSSKIPIGYPRVAARFKIVHPHLDDWDAEIRKVGTLFIPMTEKGNHTIRVCNLTRLVLRVVEADGLAIPDWVEEAMESVVGDPRAKAQATRRLIARRIGVAEAQQGA